MVNKFCPNSSDHDCHILWWFVSTKSGGQSVFSKMSQHFKSLWSSERSCPRVIYNPSFSFRFYSSCCSYVIRSTTNHCFSRVENLLLSSFETIEFLV